jgi:hypothetical protein
MENNNLIRKRFRLTYKCWKEMRQRCLNRHNRAYYNYGGRGISISKEWDHFENFFNDMGEKPKERSLDRINNNGNYCKENCRWATKKEQALNRRSNRMIEYNGEIKTLSQWAECIGMKFDTLWMRLERGKTIKDAIETPVKS